MGNMVKVVAREPVYVASRRWTRVAHAREAVETIRAHAVDASERANARLRRGRAGRSAVGALAGGAGERQTARTARTATDGEKRDVIACVLQV